MPEPDQANQSPPITTTPCKACGAALVFLQTKHGRAMPVDAFSVTDSAALFDPEKHSSHFVTCPEAGRFRKRDQRRRR